MTLELAEGIALKFFKEECWTPFALEEGYEVSESGHIDDSKGLEVYKLVLIDKEKYPFHTYVTEDE
jgi:hypothetical protein